MNEETWKRTSVASHVTRFKMAESTYTIFSHSNLFAYVNYFVTEIIEKMQLIFDHNRRPARFQLPWSVTDTLTELCLKWYMKLGKHFVLIYSPCFIKLGVVQLCILPRYMQITSYEDNMKTKRSGVHNAHADFQASRWNFRKKVRICIHG